MSSTLTTTQKIMETMAANEPQLAQIATPFTALFNQQRASIDMGAEQVSIELFKGNEKVAPLVSRMMGEGKDADQDVVRPGVAGANDYLFSLISMDFELPAGTLNKRVPGEPPYVTGGQGEEVKQFRRGYWMLKMAMDVIARVIRKNELLAKQAYFDSEMDLGDTFDGDTKLVFPRSSTLKNRTVSVAWSTAASATPWDDLGDAFKEIRAKSQVNNNNLRMSFLSDDALVNLKAIYRSQRANEGPDANMAYNEFDFNPENGAPSALQFLIDNGMEYSGWIRTSFGNAKVHLFTLPEGYDVSGTFTSWIEGETVSVGLYDPSFFKAYYGPGVLEPTADNVVQNAVGDLGVNVATPDNLTIGLSRIPTETMLLNLYELGKNQGFGATIENAPIYVPIRPDVVATIDTLTTA